MTTGFPPFFTPKASSLVPPSSSKGSGGSTCKQLQTRVEKVAKNVVSSGCGPRVLEYAGACSEERSACGTRVRGRPTLKWSRGQSMQRVLNWMSSDNRTRRNCPSCSKRITLHNKHALTTENDWVSSRSSVLSCGGLHREENKGRFLSQARHIWSTTVVTVEGIPTAGGGTNPLPAHACVRPTAFQLSSAMYCRNRYRRKNAAGSSSDVVKK